MLEINTTQGTYKGKTSQAIAPNDPPCQQTCNANFESEVVFCKRFATIKPKNRPKAWAIASAHIVPNSKSPVSAVSCFTRMTKWAKQFFIEGQKPKKRTGGINLCDEHHHTYGNGSGDPIQLGGHAEARILADMAGQLSGKTITFNIAWVDNSIDYKSYPCKSCYQMMCKAQKCGATIQICNSYNQPEPLDYCDDPKDGYMTFIKQLKEK